MSNLDRIAKISIELQSVVSSGASFDHILIVGPAPKTPLESVTIPDVGVYTSLPAVNEMGWVSEGDSADPVGIAARIAFSQNPKPTQIYIAVQKTESTGSTLEAATATLSRAEAAETGWYCALAAGIEEEDFEDMAEVPMGDYMKMIGLKTAVLLACSAKLGALIAGADERTCDYLYRFGYSLGLAFQITDDYLDTFGDTSIFGKKIGGDIINNKKSWLLTRALEKGGEMETSGVIPHSIGKAALLDAMAMKSGNEAEQNAKIAKVKNIYMELGIDEDAKYEIIKQHAHAMDYAGMIGLPRVRYEMLHRYADRLLGRTK